MTATMAKRKNESEVPTHEEDPILTPEEVGRRLGKSGTTIRRWIHEGLLTFVPNPRGLPGVRESQLNQFLGGSALNKTV